MKIAIVSTMLPRSNEKPGGVGIAVHRLANELSHLGHEVTIFSLGENPENSDYKYHSLLPEKALLCKSKIFIVYIFPWLLNFVDFSSFDVIHLHGDDWFYLRRTLPSVRSLHGSALYEARSATSLKRKIFQYIAYPLEHLAKRLATLSLAVGSSTARLHNIDIYAKNGQRPNLYGVDLSLFSPGEKTKMPSIIFIGTWEGRKRGKFLFEKFIHEIIVQYPTAMLYMITDNCSQHPQVKYLSAPSDQVLAQLLRQSWVFAYPSIYEGFGIPYIEALSSGTAIVTSANEGSNVVLENGKYGKIVDDARFSEAILQLLDREQERHEMEHKGLERAKHFSWKNVAREHEQIYLTAISQFTVS
jgi:phosphatidyl-myo-inositol alpha-mannosyltransferase